VMTRRWLCLCVCLSVRRSVCLSARVTQKQCSRTSPIFCACWPWPWLSLPLTALQYVMYFRFYGWRHVFIPWDQWADGLRQNKVAGQTYKFDSAEAANIESNVRQLQCLVEFITMRHRGRSLLSVIALLWFLVRHIFAVTTDKMRTWVYKRLGTVYTC